MELESLAEDGDPTGYTSSLEGKDDLFSYGAFNTPLGGATPAPIFPNESYEFEFTADEGSMLSLATMLVQSNDLFIGGEINLFENGVFQENLIYPSKTQLENQIKKYLAGSIALEVIKKESYVVFEDEINQAYKIAEDMVEVYKMEQSKDALIQKLKDELKTLLIQNIDEVKNIKEILLKDEVIVF